MIVPPILECIIIYWFIKGNRKTYEAIDKGFNDSLEEQMKAERMKIQSDGKKLYRVFMNLLDNALQYALEGTRVYVTMEALDGTAKVSIKNIAGYEMTFTQEEVLQRFARGDQSRTSEGSGLGLSIAESFTHVCGGDFKLVIDGDLFKVNVSFPVK